MQFSLAAGAIQGNIANTQNLIFEVSFKNLIIFNYLLGLTYNKTSNTIMNLF